MSNPANQLVQILWAAPAERRFGSGDVLTPANLAEAGIDLGHLLDAGEAQMVDTEAYQVTRKLDALPPPEPTEEELAAAAETAEVQAKVDAEAAAEAQAKADAEAAAAASSAEAKPGKSA